ncbi:MAG: hypothetical protein ACK5NF_07175 [Bacilli bacterium]
MILKVESAEIAKDKVLKFLGYSKKRPTPIILKKLDNVLNEVYKLLDIQVIVRKLIIKSISDKKIGLDDGTVIESEYACKQLMDSKYVYVAIYTLGDKIDIKISSYFESNESISGIILDKIGVVCLDNINYQIKEFISNDLGDLNISSEIYPSTKDFDISNQKKFITY